MMVFMSLVLVLIGYDWSSKRERCSDWSVAVAVIFDPSIVCLSVSRFRGFASVTNNSLCKDYLHPDDHAKRIIDTPGFKPLTMIFLLLHSFYSDHSISTFK